MKASHKFSRRQDPWIALGLFVFSLVSRIPFRSQILYHWDSVNFAYAMREFSVAKEQPQPPGYILYVWLCRLVDLLFRDAQTTMVWISIVGSALAAVALFYLGRSMFGRSTGLLAALLLATSPLFWFYGEIALPHALDTTLVIASVWCLYKTMRGNYRHLYPAVTITAIAGGVRQQTLVFLFPLLLFALRRLGWKRFLTAGTLGAIICGGWFVPLVVKSGGLSNYVQVMGQFSRRFQDTTSILMGAGWAGIRYNVRKLAMYTLYSWNAGMVPGVVYASGHFWRREWLRSADERQDWEKSAFLALWLAPSFVFYATIHMGQQGLIFVFLPALLLLSAAGLTRLLSARPGWLVAGTAVLVALNAGIFCLVPEYPLGPGTQRLLNPATLISSDHYYQDRFRAIKENFEPESTAILAANWHHVEYYLPAYTTLKWENVPGFSEREIVVTPDELGLGLDVEGQAAIIIFDSELRAFNESPKSVEIVPLEHGGDLPLLALEEGQAFRYGTHSFGLVEN
ncbi:MAG: ArnT family glycosyltransferase [bacterium]